MVSVEGECLLDVTHEGSVSDTYAGKCFSVYEGNYIASNDPILSLD